MFVGFKFVNLRAAWLWTMLAACVASASAAAPDFKGTAVPFMKKHCYECHGEKQTKADLDLARFKDDATILKDHKLWKSVLQQVNSGEMPPKKKPRPAPSDLAAFNSAIENAFALAEKNAKPDPGRVTLRRLNRTEYNHTVRDLVNVDFDPAEDFPADDIGHGFDNNGDVLSLSPVHLERYLAAAESIAARAVVLDPPKPPTRTTSSNFLEPGGYGSESTTRPVTRGFLLVRRKVTPSGDYIFRVRAGVTNAPDGEPVKMALLVNDEEKQTVTVTAPIKKWETFDLPVKLPAGEHTFSIKYLNPVTGDATNRMLFVQQFQVIGPADTRPEFQQVIAARFVNTPSATKLREFTAWFLTRAFRRPASPAELARYVKIAEAAAGADGKWEAGVQQLLKVVLCSPKFLFRVELDPLPRYPGAHPLDEFQLASRLSYFLWTTMPDEELFRLATKGQLTANLDAQVRRMLKDPKAETLTSNFALQWLQLQRLQTFAPDSKLFPSFDERLRRAMLRETELFFSEIVREDRSVLELIDADFTYVNETLARHYGLDSARGQSGYRGRGGDFRARNEFTRITLTGKERGGLLTQASILTVTSNPTRTSPVKRGKWVLEQILGTPPPPPPPNVPDLDGQKQLTGTLRQRMEQHRENPSCAGCHKQMDTLGFAFENYDAVGRFRSKDADGSIDPSGTLPDGQSFHGPAELKALLKGKQELVVRNLAEKLLTYGLGRGLEFYDNRALNQICEQTARSGHKFSALVTAVVKSDPFRLRRGLEQVKQSESAE